MLNRIGANFKVYKYQDHYRLHVRPFSRVGASSMFPRSGERLRVFPHLAPVEYFIPVFSTKVCQSAIPTGILFSRGLRQLHVQIHALGICFPSLALGCPFYWFQKCLLISLPGVKNWAPKRVLKICFKNKFFKAFFMGFGICGFLLTKTNILTERLNASRLKREVKNVSSQTKKYR